MARRRREKILDITREEIKEAARELMKEKGTAGLSMRAIARHMEMTAPALYHYFANLDELITALIVDGFRRLADALEAAAVAAEGEQRVGQLTAVAHANRRWALTHPVDFQLLYGNPIPGYEQPIERTYPQARRSFVVTAQIFTTAIAEGELVVPDAYRSLPNEIAQSIATLTEEDGHDLPEAALYLTASAWTKIHGHIMLELFQLIQPVIANVDAFFAYEMTQFMQQVGFQKSENS